MKVTVKKTIEIRATYTSHNQAEILDRKILNCLHALQFLFESKHQKNKLIFTTNGSQTNSKKFKK